MKVEIRGILHAIETNETKNSNGFVQSVLIKVPGRTDEFGTVISQESFYNLEKYSKTLDGVPLIDQDAWVGKKVICEAWLNSNLYAQTGKKDQYILNLAIKSIKEYEPAAN